jgi:vacuolar-type H+-ATPase subunit E/Vma4
MTDAHLDRLLEELGARATAELNAVRDAAVANAADVLAAAAANVDARGAAALAACDAECERHRANALATTRREARAALLHAQHALVDRVIGRAKAIIVQRLAAESSSELLTKRSAALAAFAFGHANVVRGAEGLRLEADDGRLTIDDTVDAWLARRRARIAIDVCRAVERDTAG